MSRTSFGFRAGPAGADSLALCFSGEGLESRRARAKQYEGSAEMSDADDRFAIIAVLDRYAECLDQRDWPGLAEVFTQDVEIDWQEWQQSGLHEVTQSIRSYLDGCGPSQHLLGNYRIVLDGDRATSKHYCRVMHMGKGPQRGQDLRDLDRIQGRAAPDEGGLAIDPARCPRDHGSGRSLAARSGMKGRRRLACAAAKRGARAAGHPVPAARPACAAPASVRRSEGPRARGRTRPPSSSIPFRSPGVSSHGQ